ncbi:hypothetical protein CEXT_456081 [Caerostris extrusa]|uniref:Uncharacterized protein n=1 Tax=Caerostris extrusa TaxID=172846 RepID=A0AAV4YD29_CAEEX|nr:hypothetical protein CEXT_456081 [Caerostris extrusa]
MRLSPLHFTSGCRHEFSTSRSRAAKKLSKEEEEEKRKRRKKKKKKKQKKGSHLGSFAILFIAAVKSCLEMQR